MISDEVAREGLAALSVAAVMLIEDAIDGLTTGASDSTVGMRFAFDLATLGSDLGALAAAAAVLTRRRVDDV